MTPTPSGRTGTPGAQRPRQRRLAAACAALCLACTAALAAPLDDMRRQVEASQFEQAWATAQANPQLIGDVHFDFLYGVAAINVGRVSEGLLALERHLSAVPANDRARLELARGYFLLGEYARARTEFEFVLRYNPPAGVRANIAGYLQAMQVRELAESRSSARFYAEAGAAHNSNVNGGTWHDTVQTKIGALVPDPPARQISDDQVLAAIGGQKLMRVSNRLSVFAGFDINHAQNSKAQEFNLSNAGGYIGLTQLSSIALWRLTLSANELLVGNQRYRDTLGLAVESSLTVNSWLSAMGYGSYEEHRHAQPDDVRDARVATLGGMLTVTLSDLWGAPSFGVRASVAQEHNLSFHREFGNDTQQLRFFGALAPIERLRLSAGFTASRQKYQAEELLYGTVRKDLLLSLDAAASYAITDSWQLRADASWSTTRSNQDLSDYGRKALSLKLRYQY